MLTTKNLGSASGIQQQAVADRTESDAGLISDSVVIVGKFLRGRTDKPFRVTRDNYQTMLGRDPNSPSYKIVEDVFQEGVDEVSVFRVGSSGVDEGVVEVPETCDKPSDVFEFSDLTWNAELFLEGISQPWNNTGIQGYVVMANITINGVSKNHAVSFTSRGTMEGWAPQVSYLVGKQLIEKLRDERVYLGKYRYGASDPTQKIIGLSYENITNPATTANDEHIGDLARGLGMVEMLGYNEETYAVTFLVLSDTFVIVTDPAEITISKVAEKDMAALHASEVTGSSNYLDLQFVDIYNAGQDIKIHSCGRVESSLLETPYEVELADGYDEFASLVKFKKG